MFRVVRRFFNHLSVDSLHAHLRVGLNLRPVGLDFELVMVPERVEEGGKRQQIGEFLPFGGVLPLPGQFVANDRI